MMQAGQPIPPASRCRDCGFRPPELRLGELERQTCEWNQRSARQGREELLDREASDEGDARPEREAGIEVPVEAETKLAETVSPQDEVGVDGDGQWSPEGVAQGRGHRETSERTRRWRVGEGFGELQKESDPKPVGDGVAQPDCFDEDEAVA